MNINPEKLVMSIIGKNINPTFQNLMKMAQGGNKQQLITFAKNYCKERNKDFNKEFQTFMKNFK